MEKIDYRGLSFTVIPMDACVPTGERLAAAGKHWHSHVLSPGCVHNPFDGHYAVVVEDDAENITYIAEGTEAFPEADKVLVKMLHGDDILDPAAAKGGSEAAKDSLLLAHILRLQEKGLRWHHHMHFPGCAFNPHPGKWSIGVESPGAFYAEAFDDEPVDTLREVEVIYFGNLEKA